MGLTLDWPGVFAMRVRPFRLLGSLHRVQPPRNPCYLRVTVHYYVDFPEDRVDQNYQVPPYGETVVGVAVGVPVAGYFAFWEFVDRRIGRMTAKVLTAERIRQTHLDPGLQESKQL